ncbi:2-oxoglutarate dehydrogenase complex dihydrolipoyllysine-residue succinyltransferase [Mucisphaera sp.]|uniref:2-oxoglutarate dehydrogenase complex dihydrolipoyllysine-residue succinyltransferase n=1 Tax=Mucisphaera sp. TaxID=2913024 RepID=UPI003D0B1EAB
MSVELIVPEVGESITEVEIGQWLKQEGDVVSKDDTLCEIETDKVTLELPAPADGVVGKLLKKQGETASVGDVIGYLEEGGVSGNGAAKAETKPAETKKEKPAEAKQEAKAASSSKPAAEREAAQKVGDKLVMPAAAVLLEKHGLSAADVEATGPGGRLLKEDVLAHVAGGSKPAASEAPGAKSEKVAAPVPVATSGDAAELEEVVPMTPLRRRVAEHLKNAQNTAALLTTFNEIDMSAVMDLRAKYKDGFEKKHGVKLGFMSFFVKASIDALKQIPAVNAEIRGTDIVYKNHYDIGIAVSAPKGLVVPVLRHAERMSFAEVESGIGDFVTRIKSNQLRLEEMQGGTFTITNGGIFGSLLSTPIVNAPQSAVLGMHAIQQRPVAVDGEVVIRPMMYTALTYDHRLIDGREAVTFLVRLKQALEDPSRMLLEA